MSIYLLINIIYDCKCKFGNTRNFLGKHCFDNEDYQNHLLFHLLFNSRKMRNSNLVYTSR